MSTSSTLRLLGRARVVLLAFAVALSTGCSMVKTSYDNADWLTLLWLNRYVDLDAAQETWAKGRIRNFHDWHRRTELPQYAQLLRRSESLLRNPVAAADILALNEEITARLDASVARAMPDIGTLALQLSPEQIATMERKFEKNNVAFRKDYIDTNTEKRQENRYKSVMWMAELFFGDFSPEQEATIRRASDARPLINEVWLAERLARQRDLVAVLKRIRAEKPPPGAVVLLLEAQARRATDIASIPDPVMRATTREAAANAAKLGAMIVNLTTPEQKERAVRKLQEWSDDLRVLSQQRD